MPQETPLLLRRFAGRELEPQEEETPELLRRFAPSPGEELAGAGFSLLEGAARGIGGMVSAPGIALEMAGRAPRGTPVRAMAELPGLAVGALKPSVAGPAIRRAGEAIGRMAEPLRPKKAAATETFGAELAGAVGSALSFVGPTAIGSLGLRALSLAPRASNLIAGITTGVAANASGGYFEALAESGDHEQAAWAAEQARVAGADRASVRRAYEEVLNETGNREQAFMAFLMQGALVGPFETMGLGGSAGKLARIMARADATQVGAISSALSKLLIEETAQEGYGQLVANLGAHLIGYDEDREAWEGVAKAATLGGLAGFIVGGPIELLANMQQRAAPPERSTQAGPGAAPSAQPGTAPDAGPGPLVAAPAPDRAEGAAPAPQEPSGQEEAIGEFLQPANVPRGTLPAATPPTTVGELIRAVGVGQQAIVQAGERFEPPRTERGTVIVYRLGSSPTLAGKDFGTAERVAAHLESTTERGIAAGTRLYAWEVPAEQVHMTKGDTRFGGGLPQGRAPADVQAKLLGEIEASSLHPEFVSGPEIERAFGFRPRIKVERAELSSEEMKVQERFAEFVERAPEYAKAEYRKRFGNVMNSDNARELSADYLGKRSLSAAVHEPASALVKEVYRDMLTEPVPAGKEPFVLFTGGGTGAGKTGAIEGVPALKAKSTKAQIVYDTNLDSFDSSRTKIDQALDAGKPVAIAYVYRDPMDALVGGALPRAMKQEAKFGSGRTVPLGVHLKTHVQARETIERLRQHYAGEPDVTFMAVDNSRGRGKAVEVPFASLPTLRYAHGELDAALRQALEAERAAGRISAAVFQGFAGDAGAGGKGARAGAQGLRGAPERARAPERAEAEVARPPPEVAVPPAPPAAAPARPSEIPRSLAPEVSAVELVGGRTLPVRYALVNTDHLIPSHDARAGFRKNPQGDINERPYDDPIEGRPMRETVLAIAQAPKPSLLTTDTPSPVDGPPIVTTRGVVLGGNARAMGVQLAYSRGGEQAETLRTAMLAAAKRFGISAHGFGANPMLVRVVPEEHEGAPGELSRILNEALTTAKGATTEAVSRGSKVTAPVAREIAGVIGEGTLRDALNEQAKARDIARALVSAGAMTQRDLDALFDPTRGIPTAAGKQVIEDALLGSVVQDVRVLSETPASARNAILRALPSLITLKGRIPTLPVTIKHVAQGAAEVATTGQPLGDVLDQQVLPGIDVGWKSDESAVGILRSLLTEKPTRFAGRFERLAQRSRELGAGQGSFLSEENLPLEEQLAAEFGALEPQMQLMAFPGAITEELRGMLAPKEPLRASAVRARARPAGVPVQRWLERAVQRFVDYFEPVGRLQKAIPPSIETENVYQAETLRRGRTKDRIEREIREPFLKPILALMRGRRLTQVEVDEYLLARHAAERNRTIAERQPETAPIVLKLRELEASRQRILAKGEEVSEGIEAEIDQLSEQLEELVEAFSEQGIGIGMSDEEAGEILAKVAEDPRRAAFEATGNLVDKMHRHVRKVWVDAGLESAELVESLEKWSHYVPARTDLGEGLEGVGGSRRLGRQFKPALGRKTRADHPLAFSFIQAEQAIARAERNKVRQALLAYVRAHEEDLEGVLRVVEVPKRRALVAGMVREIGDPFFLGRADVVTVREGGETIGLEVDRRYLDLARALNFGPETIEGVTRLMAQVNRIRAALITRYRPVFWPRNLIRDVKSSWYAGQELGARFAMRTTRDVPKAMRALATGKGPWTAQLEEFRRAGAPISFLDLAGLEDTLKRMESELAAAGPGTIAQSRVGWRRLLEVMNKMADVSENATRLSAFVHAREDLGWSAEKAGAWAKELQNFERRGLWGNHVNAWYMFANAGIQGGRRFVQALRNPLVSRTIAVSFVASMAWDQIMRAVGGEADDGEDWWDKVPDFEKRGNFVILYPDGSGRRVTIPAPFVWGAFNNAGQELSAALSGDKDPWEAGASIVAGFANSLSPVGDVMGQGDTGALAAALPDVARPAFELAVNRDWRGKPIMPSDFGEGKPDSERFWPDADPRAIAAARWLNRSTGGTTLKPGTIDVSPESLEHLLRFFSSGVPQDIRELHDLERKLEGRDLITNRDVPIVKSFVRAPSLFESGQQQRDLMRELRAEEKGYFVEDEKGRKRLASPGRRPPPELAQLLADGRAVEKQRELRLTTIEGMQERARLPVLQEIDLAAMRWNKRAREFMLSVQVQPTAIGSSP